MSEKIDFKKNDRELYTASEAKPSIINVPDLPFIWIEETGDLNKPSFANAVGALYNLSYTIRMSEKSGDAPDGYFPYVVPPLEGEWTLAEGDFLIRETRMALPGSS